MITELARWPEYYGELEVQVFAPAFYYPLPKKDDYSAKIVFGKNSDWSDYFLEPVKNVFLSLPYAPDLLVIVPSSKLGKFSPTLIALGAKLSKLLGVKNENILIRIKEGKKHTDCRDYNERYKATTGAFKVARHLDGEKIAFLDDTRATGMTFLECAKELKAAGASNIVAVCLGINK